MQNTAELLAHELGVPLEEVTFDSAGVNHTAWFTTFRRGAEDLIPRIRSVMRARYIDETEPLLPRSDDPYESIERVRAELMQLTGYFHTESSHHASEYWAWFRKTPGAGQPLPGPALGQPGDLPAPSTRSRPTRSSSTRPAATASGTAASSPRRSWTAWSPARRGSVLRQRPQRRPDHEPAARTRASRWPAWPTRNGVRPGRYGALPPACAALNEVQIAVQRLTVQAAMTGNRELVHAAVALDPLTSAMSTLPKIHEMTDRMLAAEAEWLPQFEPSAQRNADDGYLAGMQR